MKNNIFINIIYTISSFLPLINLLLLYTFFLRATFKLGHLPIPSIDDPKDLNMDIHHISIYLVYLLNFLNIFFWFLLSGFFTKQPKKINKNAMIFFTGIIISLIQLFIDPFKIVYWFLD